MKTILLLLFPLLLSAQKEANARLYLGDSRFENEKPVGIVSFQFAKQSFTRTGDGVKTYDQLLKDVTGYQDAGAGELQAIIVNGKSIPRSTAPATLGMDSAKEWTMPDSAQTAASADHAIKQIDRTIESAKQQIKPWWKVANYLLSAVIVGLLLIAGLLRYVAKTAAGESRTTLYGTAIFGRWLIPIHQFCAFWLLVISWLIVGATLINIFLFYQSSGLPLWLAVILWVITLRFAEKLTNMIVPDIRTTARGNGPRHNFKGIESGE